jgi:hypothetical protein
MHLSRPRPRGVEYLPSPCRGPGYLLAGGVPSSLSLSSRAAERQSRREDRVGGREGGSGICARFSKTAGRFRVCLCFCTTPRPLAPLSSFLQIGKGVAGWRPHNRHGGEVEFGSRVGGKRGMWSVMGVWAAAGIGSNVQACKLARDGGGTDS